MANQDLVNASHKTFDHFVQAQYCKDVKQHFAELCRQLDLNPKDFRNFYIKLKERLNYWKAKALWTKLDKRASHPDYQQGKVCTRNKVPATSEMFSALFTLPQSKLLLFHFFCFGFGFSSFGLFVSFLHHYA